MASKMGPSSRSGLVNEPSFALEPRKTALIVVDMQYASASRTEGMGKKLASEGNEGLAGWRFDRIEDLVIPNILRLLQFFRFHQLPIIYTTVGSETPDFSDSPYHMRDMFRSIDLRLGTRVHEILDELKPLPGELVLNKTTMSAFPSTNLEEVLQTMNVSYLVFTGVSTNFCVEATARNAVDYGYRSVMVEDASSAYNKEWQDNAIDMWRRFFGRAIPTEKLIVEMENALEVVVDT